MLKSDRSVCNMYANCRKILGAINSKIISVAEYRLMTKKSPYSFEFMHSVASRICIKVVHVTSARSPRYKTNTLTTEPKSRPINAVVRGWLYTRSYAKLRWWECWPITLPLIKEVIIYGDRKPFWAKLMSNFRLEPPSYDMIAVRNVKHICIFPCPGWGSIPGLPGTRPMLKQLSQRVDSLTQLSEIDNIQEAMRNLLFVDM